MFAENKHEVCSLKIFIQNIMQLANLNNLFKFIDLRTHEGAQWEIQQLAKGMLEIAEMCFPVTVEAWKENKV